MLGAAVLDKDALPLPVCEQVAEGVSPDAAKVGNVRRNIKTGFSQ